MTQGVSCFDMKKGQVYTCEECGIELQVIKECSEECRIDTGCCADDGFMCCGEPLRLKE
ncbi:conserved hypothetical protein [Methanosalsum zhilinae DSM 4017]|uniref:Uncharacterized protein n=1 Tax=Methanosalsum zhilinae (strain DSM 4017 / NBRC 107636 / OCM 62 / WeN5) TaxID=679901 RepID=F7XL69_METZD|nr:hypothetical protein [Methanosalsum zhilinae]AEH60133.1 conserved hypothetical protein [Methanosalsum zhilinae DSM 4017]